MTTLERIDRAPWFTRPAGPGLFGTFATLYSNMYARPRTLEFDRRGAPMEYRHFALPTAFLTITLCACGVFFSPSGPGYSGVRDGTYVNEYFGLTMTVPDGWSVATEDSEKFMQDVGTEIAVGEDAGLRAAVQASKRNTYQLLTLFEHEVGAPVEFNPNIILMAERVSHAPGVKTGEDYLYHTTNMLKKSSLPYRMTKKTHATRLGEREWYRVDYVINQPWTKINQSYLATKHGDYVLVVILSGGTGEQMRNLEDLAGTIKL